MQCPYAQDNYFIVYNYCALCIILYVMCYSVMCVYIYIYIYIYMYVHIYIYICITYILYKVLECR